MNISLSTSTVTETTISKNLIEQKWFVAKDWNLRDLHFKEYKWDEEIDHNWHEFANVEETDEKGTTEKTVEGFLKRIAVKQ